MSKIVERTMDFFEAFAHAKRPLSLSDLMRTLGIPASSAHDVIRALEQRGYVHETAPRAGFYPTRKLFELTRVIAAHDSVAIRAEPLMQEISQKLGETVALSKATAAMPLYLLVVEPADPVRYSVSAGSEIQSLHATSVGKSLLSTVADDRWPTLLGSRPLRRFTPNTIVSRSRLRDDVNDGKARGWFVNDEESRAGVLTLSMPFAWNRGLHFLTVAGPAVRMTPKIKATVGIVRRAVDRLADPVRSLEEIA